MKEDDMEDGFPNAYSHVTERRPPDAPTPRKPLLYMDREDLVAECVDMDAAGIVDGLTTEERIHRTVILVLEWAKARAVGGSHGRSLCG
jgi:hypothetical protein